MSIQTVELFAGIGGFRLASESLGFQTVWANDIDPRAVAVYKSNFGASEIVEGDINVFIDIVPNHDLLTGGFPCQPFSKAGKKLGVDDYRGTLFESIVKVLMRCEPRYFVLENVTNLLSLDKGRHFQTILSALSGLGYKIEWRVYNAAAFGLPQHRERIVISGTRTRGIYDSYLITKDDYRTLPYKSVEIISDSDCWRSIVSNKPSFCTWGMSYGDRYVTCNVPDESLPHIKLSDFLQKDVPREFYFTDDTRKRIESSIFVDKFYNGVHILYNQGGGARMGYTIFDTDGIAPTLTASTSRHYERYRVGDEFRRLTNIEYARLQGFPDDHCKVVSPYNQYKLFGNAVPPDMVRFVMDRVVNEKYIAFSNNQLKLF